MMKIKLLALFSVLPMLFSQAIASTPSIVIKFSHVVGHDTPKGKAAQRFKELSEKATKGRVQVQIYPDGQLFKDQDELKALQNGNVQMLAPSLSKISALGIKEFDVFDLPYIFPSKRVLYETIDGPIGQNLLKKLEPHGLAGLAYWDNGFKVITANKPLHSPQDLKGLRLRIQSANPVVEAQMKALGVATKVMSFADTYRALHEGVIDGAENVPSNIYSRKIHQVQRHLTVSNHGYLGYAVLTNKKFWNNLPADIRTHLEQALKEATTYERTIAQQDNEQALEEIKKSGKTVVYQLNPKEQATWRRALLPVHDQIESSLGRELIKSIDKETVLP